jgi:CubicO group peptidase (beta-lactamase class C family)
MKKIILRQSLSVLVLFLFAAALFGLGHEISLKTKLNKKKLISELEKTVPDLMEKANIPGLSIAVIRDGQILWQKGFGIKNAKTGERVADNTIFEAASLTKPFFAYLVMQMVEKGEIDLDTPLIKYAPKDYIEKSFINHSMDLEGFRKDWFNKINARMVLSHSSGLPHGERQKPLPIFFEPGTKYRYSADGYFYLQRVIEHLKGEPLEEIMRKQVIEPLKMENSSMVWQDRYETQASVGHDIFGETNGQFRKRKQAHAAATLYTTAEDYAKFVTAILNDVGLKSETVQKMLTPQVDVDKNVFWSLGFGLEHTDSGDAFWQWGDYGIFRNYIVAFKQQKIGVVYLTNSFNGLSIGQEIINHSVGDVKDLGLAHLNYDQFDSPALALAQVFVKKGLGEALKKYHRLKAKDPEALNERRVNSFGYALLGANKIKEAIEFFKLNVEAYPKSANVYDSLAEAYEKNGDIELSIQYYKKALEAIPNDPRPDKEFLENLKQSIPKNLERLEKKPKK